MSSGAAVDAGFARPGHVLVVGLGVAGRAVVDACLARGLTVVATDDAPTDELRAFAADRSIPLVEAPAPEAWSGLVAEAAAVHPAPGLPDAHPVFTACARAGTTVVDELDLAQRWDPRPCVAITGTNGKTTVTTLVTRMLQAAGVAATDAGNTDVPYVSAIDDPEVEVFVVEASSFRLAHSCSFSPRIGAWLNYAPDHLDVHASLAHYEAAKARIFDRLAPGSVAVVNDTDPVVASHRPDRPGVAVIGFGAQTSDYRVEQGTLVGPDGPLVDVADLPRALPHDVANALAAAACARAAGADVASVATVLRAGVTLDHRVEFVRRVRDVDWYDDSKATVPQATLAAVTGFDSVVLVAGGRNKGLDLGVLGESADHVRAVVAIGESAREVAAAFAGRRPVVIASSMAEAVRSAADLARPGDTVLLSPACASFDWYADYHERGRDFAALVRALPSGGGDR